MSLYLSFLVWKIRSVKSKQMKAFTISGVKQLLNKIIIVIENMGVVWELVLETGNLG